MVGLTLEIDGTAVEVSSSQQIVVGRDAGATLRVPHELVSRRHLGIAFDSERWLAQDLGTSNGTFLNGVQLPAHERVQLEPGLTLVLGDPVAGVRVRVVGTGRVRAAAGAVDGATDLSLAADVQVVPVADPSGRGGAAVAFTRPGGPITIGRAPDNAIVIHDPMVSAHHARVVQRPDGSYLIEDLHSTNGSFVDGVRVDRRELGSGSVLSFGRVVFRTTPAGLVRIAQEPQTPGPPSANSTALSVSQVTYTVPTSKREQAVGGGPRKALLDRVTFSVPHRSLVAVIGPSGAGKSTMLKAMIGVLRPDSGQVLFNGLDMAVFANSVADRVGMVPQDDLVHNDLTARQALDYAARLRFPDDASPAERSSAVDWVLSELGLAQHADTRIGRLSGGQRKRVSTAMELLTKPDLLFLDEPTSGLDPNLDREVMELLRDLAHGTPQNPSGRTVVVITHSTDNLDKADLVLLLAPGGKVAYFGPPGDLRRFFVASLGNDADYASIYGLISRQPDQAQAAFASSPLAPQVAGAGDPHPDSAAESRVRRRRWTPQVLTLLGRQARLMAADRSLLLFTLALPIVVGLLTLAVRASSGFNPATTTSAVGEPRILLVVLVFGAVLMGMVPSVRQLVGERPIFTREAGVGVRPSAYLAAKIALFGVVCTIQSVLMVAVALAVNAHPGRGVAWPLAVELVIVTLATSWTCSTLGLLLSGLVTTSDQVMPLMVLVLMFQLVMCGGVLNVTGPGINQASLLSPSRWGFAGAASSLDLNRTVVCQAQILAKAKEDEEVNRKSIEATDEANQKAADKAIKNGMPAPTPEKPEVRHSVVDCATVDDQDRLWEPSGTRWIGNLLALGFWSAAYAAGTYLTLRRLTRK